MVKIEKSVWNIIEKLAKSIFRLLCGILKRVPAEEEYLAFLQFVKFGIIGASNTVISYLLYSGCLLLFRRFGILGKADYLVAQLVGFLLSVLWSFYWNHKKVFVQQGGEKRSIWKALLKTYLAYSFTGLLLNSLLLLLWVQVLHISEFIAPVINLLVSVPLNFVINKFWAFK